MQISIFLNHESAHRSYFENNPRTSYKSCLLYTSDAADHGHGVAEAAGHAVEHAATFEAGFTIPMFLELGTMIGFLSLFMYLAFSQLTKAKLEPQNDPYYEESLHHHV